MRLLLCLAEHAGDVVSIDELLKEVWSGVIVTQDSVYQAVASLRRQLGDDAKEPAYIATVPRLGYRMVATVSPWADEQLAPMAPAAAVTSATSSWAITAESMFGLRRRTGVLVAAGGALCVALIAAFLLFNKSGIQTPPTGIPPKSVAVLPFLESLVGAGAFVVNRSGGSQIKSIWQSAEMTSYFIGMSSVRAWR